MQNPAQTPIGPHPRSVASFLELIWRDGDVRELRIPNYNRWRHTAAGWFDDPVKMARSAAAWDGRANIYVSLNPGDPRLLGRAYNRVKERADATTTDRDIVRRTWMLVDVDATRPAGISSSDAELRAARGVMISVRDHLRGLDWPEPITAMSGNGWYLLCPIDLPNDAESTTLVKNTLEALARQFNTEQAHIDTSVHNASRIVGLVGMLKVKGDPLPDRPHRRSYVEAVPS